MLSALWSPATIPWSPVIIPWSPVILMGTIIATGLGRDVLSCWQLPPPSPASVSPGMWTRSGDRDTLGESMGAQTGREQGWHKDECRQNAGGYQRSVCSRWVGAGNTTLVAHHCYPISGEVTDRDRRGPTTCCPRDTAAKRIQQPQQLVALIFMAVLAGKRLTLYVLPFSLNGTVIYPLTRVTCCHSRFPGAPRPADIPTHHQHARGCTERGVWGQRGMAQPPPPLATPNCSHRWVGAMGSRAPHILVPPCCSHSPRPCPM